MPLGFRMCLAASPRFGRFRASLSITCCPFWDNFRAVKTHTKVEACLLIEGSVTGLVIASHSAGPINWISYLCRLVLHTGDISLGAVSVPFCRSYSNQFWLSFQTWFQGSLIAAVVSDSTMLIGRTVLLKLNFKKKICVRFVMQTIRVFHHFYTTSICSNRAPSSHSADTLPTLHYWPNKEQTTVDNCDV